jgi:hypothetical protein
MRQARIKPSEVDTFMHLYKRVAGPLGDRPFGPAEKECCVKNVMVRARGEAAVAKRRLTRACRPDPAAPRPEVYCFKRLREIV